MATRTTLLTELGKLFRSHRAMLGKTQSEIAAAVPVTQSSYSAYECGDALPTVPVLLALLRILEIPLSAVQALLPDDDDEPNGAERAA